MNKYEKINQDLCNFFKVKDTDQMLCLFYKHMSFLTGNIFKSIVGAEYGSDPVGDYKKALHYTKILHEDPSPDIELYPWEAVWNPQDRLSTAISGFKSLTNEQYAMCRCLFLGDTDKVEDFLIKIIDSYEDDSEKVNEAYC